jgi:transposase InsO family protein
MLKSSEQQHKLVPPKPSHCVCSSHGRQETLCDLLQQLGLRGVMRGKVVRTTVSDGKAPCPLDRVNRQFRAERPNQLWVSDYTYVSTWQGWL